jgi:hypothetical protein
MPMEGVAAEFQANAKAIVSWAITPVADSQAKREDGYVAAAPRNQNNRSRGLLYIFPGAGTLRKNASAN